MGAAEPWAWPTEDVLGMARWVKEAVLSKAIPGEVIRLVGYSAGGVLALEAARMLAAEGYDVAPVILLDTLAPIPVHKRGLLSSAKASTSVALVPSK